MAEVNILFMGSLILVSIELNVINCFIIWHILYVEFTLKISFYHDIGQYCFSVLHNTSYYMILDNVFSDWLTPLETFFDKTL
jgi:hypothetical protein